MGRTSTTKKGAEVGTRPVHTTDLPLIAPVREWHELIPSLARDHLYAAAGTGELRVLRRGRRILVPRASLLAWLGEPLESMSIEPPRSEPEVTP